MDGKAERGDGDVLLGDLSRPWQADMAPFQRVTGLVVQREVLLALVPLYLHDRSASVGI